MCKCALVVLPLNRWMKLQKVSEHKVHAPAHRVFAIRAVADFLLVGCPLGIDLIIRYFFVRATRRFKSKKPVSQKQFNLIEGVLPLHLCHDAVKADYHVPEQAVVDTIAAIRDGLAEGGIAKK